MKPRLIAQDREPRFPTGTNRALMRCIFAHESSHDYPHRPAGTGVGIDSVRVVIAARDDSLFLVVQE